MMISDVTGTKIFTFLKYIIGNFEKSLPFLFN